MHLLKMILLKLYNLKIKIIKKQKKQKITDKNKNKINKIQKNRQKVGSKKNVKLIIKMKKINNNQKLNNNTLRKIQINMTKRPCRKKTNPMS